MLLWSARYAERVTKIQDVTLDFTFLSGVQSFPFQHMLFPPGTRSTQPWVWDCWTAGAQTQRQTFPSLASTTPPSQCDAHYASEAEVRTQYWDHTNLTVALWLSGGETLTYFLWIQMAARAGLWLSKQLQIHLAAADPDESRICPIFPSWPSANQFKKRLLQSQKLCCKAGPLRACVSEAARDSGYVAFQDQNLKVGVWHCSNQLSFTRTDTWNC